MRRQSQLNLKSKQRFCPQILYWKINLQYITKLIILRANQIKPNKNKTFRIHQTLNKCLLTMVDLVNKVLLFQPPQLGVKYLPHLFPIVVMKHATGDFIKREKVDIRGHLTLINRENGINIHSTSQSLSRRFQLRGMGVVFSMLNHTS